MNGINCLGDHRIGVYGLSLDLQLSAEVTVGAVDFVHLGITGPVSLTIVCLADRVVIFGFLSQGLSKMPLK